MAATTLLLLLQTPGGDRCYADIRAEVSAEYNDLELVRGSVTLDNEPLLFNESCGCYEKWGDGGPVGHVITYINGNDEVFTNQLLEADAIELPLEFPMVIDADFALEVEWLGLPLLEDQQAVVLFDEVGEVRDLGGAMSAKRNRMPRRWWWQVKHCVMFTMILVLSIKSTRTIRHRSCDFTNTTCSSGRLPAEHTGRSITRLLYPSTL